MKTLEYLSPTVGFGHFLLDGQRLSAQETSVSRTNLTLSQVKINKNFLFKIVDIFLLIISCICFGCSKELSH